MSTQLRSSTRYLLPTLLATVVVALLASRSVTCVPAGHVGVVMAFGKVKESTLGEGMRFRSPHLTVMPVSVQSRSYSVGFPANDANAAVSSDMQTVGFQVNIGWYVQPDQAWQLVRYVSQNEGSWTANVIDPAMRQGVKAVFSRRSLREIVQNREQVRVDIAAEIQSLVQERLNERHEGLGTAIQITQVTLDNVDYSNEFEQIIEATQREEQRARLAENELRRVEIEAQQQVVQAQAQRQAEIERARGEAEAHLIRIEAQVQGYLALRQAGFDLGSYRFMEVWDGELPGVLAGDDSLQVMLSRTENGTISTEEIGLILDTVREARTSLHDQYDAAPPADSAP